MRGSHRVGVCSDVRRGLAAAVVGAAVALTPFAPAAAQARRRAVVPARAVARTPAQAPKRAAPSTTRPVRVVFGHKLG